MRKMLVAMAKDVRVLLIKLADRLHNMRTIASLPEAKQKRIAQETLDIYAPLAHRLGVQDVKWQLEDLAFAVLAPEALRRDRGDGAPARGERERYLEEVVGAVRSRLEQLHIDAEVTGRPKHYWSIYEKMVVRGKEFAEINDLVGVRVIVDSVKDCYGALGLDPRALASGTGPVQGLHRDAQVQPLPVVAHDGGGSAGPARSSSRSAPTRCTAARSTASPRTGATRSSATRPRTSCGCNGSSTGRRRRPIPTEFMQSLKIDLEQDEVFVFTPKGRVDHAAHRGDAGRLRVRDPHRGRAPVHRRAGERPAGAARVGDAVGRHVRDLHEQGRRRGSEPRLAPVRADAPRQLEDPAVVLA